MSVFVPLLIYIIHIVKHGGVGKHGWELEFYWQEKLDGKYKKLLELWKEMFMANLSCDGISIKNIQNHVC